MTSKPHGSSCSFGSVCLTFAVLGLLVGLTSCATLVNQRAVRYPNDSLDLIQRLQERKAKYIKQSEEGAIVSLVIPRDLGTDQTLAAVGGIWSLQDLKLYLSQDSSRFTKEGVESLAVLTNLVSLRVWCAEQLPPMVFYEITRLKRLQHLELVASDAPIQEYDYLTNLCNLTELHMELTPNFGDAQSSLLTNLAQLRSVVLLWTGVHEVGANNFRHHDRFTNVILRLKPPTTSGSVNVKQTE